MQRADAGYLGHSNLKFHVNSVPDDAKIQMQPKWVVAEGYLLATCYKSICISLAPLFLQGVQKLNNIRIKWLDNLTHRCKTK